MLSKVLLISVVCAQDSLFEDIDNGQVCFGYDSCNSGCCLQNINLKSTFYPDDITKTYNDAEITAIAAEIETLKTTGTTTVKDGITHYTSVDGTTHVDVPEYVLSYTP